LFNAAWPELLRPSNCHVVFEPFRKNFVAAVDPRYPNAWRIGAAQAAIEYMLKNGKAVVVVISNEKHVLLSEGKTPMQVWNDIDGVLKEYGRAKLRN